MTKDSLNQTKNIMNITEKLKLKLPLFQAPFTCYPNQENLVAEVSNNGALGIFSTSLQALSEIKEGIDKIQQKTAKAFAVLIDTTNTDDDVDLADHSQANEYLKDAYKALGINSKNIVYLPNTTEITELVINKKPAVIIFANGLPTADVVADCHEKSITTMALVSNTLEAITADKVVDAIILQGSESAGMQSRFPNDLKTTTFPSNTLLQHAIANTSKPLIVWGDAQSPQHVVSALINGASCVVIDSPFWTTTESSIPDSYRQILLTQHNEMQTSLTNVWLGQPTQTIKNQLTESANNNKNILSAKKQQRIMFPIIREAIAQDNPNFMPLWAGLCAVSTTKNIAELCENFLTEINEIIT